MQCKDIDDVGILEFVQDCNDLGLPALLRNPTYEGSVMRLMPRNTPFKVARAKMARLVQRSLLDGCGCGCVGNFFLTEKGLRYLETNLNPSVKHALH